VTRSFRVVVLPSTQTTLAASASTFHTPTVVNFTGAVRRLGGTGLAGQAVALQYRLPGSTTWRTTRTTRTDSRGTARFSLTVSLSAQWRLVYSGATPYLASTCPLVTITRR